jgi:hypothetical protein
MFPPRNGWRVPAHRAATAQEAHHHGGFFNTDEVSARLLLDKFPICADGQRPHVVIGHLDALGAWVVWHSARDWRHDRPHGDTTPLLVTVLDDDAQPRIRALLGQYPELEQACAFISASA